MKFNARYLLVILLLALLGCSMFTCKMVEGLTGATDQAVDPKTLQPLPEAAPASSRPVPAPTGKISAGPADYSGAVDTLPPSGATSKVTPQSPENEEKPMGEVTSLGAKNVAPV